VWALLELLLPIRHSIVAAGKFGSYRYKLSGHPTFQSTKSFYFFISFSCGIPIFFSCLTIHNSFRSQGLIVTTNCWCTILKVQFQAMMSGLIYPLDYPRLFWEFEIIGLSRTSYYFWVNLSIGSNSPTWFTSLIDQVMSAPFQITILPKTCCTCMVWDLFHKQLGSFIHFQFCLGVECTPTVNSINSNHPHLSQILFHQRISVLSLVGVL